MNHYPTNKEKMPFETPKNDSYPLVSQCGTPLNDPPMRSMEPSKKNLLLIEARLLSLNLSNKIYHSFDT